MEYNSVKCTDGTWMTAIRRKGEKTVFGCGFTKTQSVKDAERKIYMQGYCKKG